MIILDRAAMIIPPNSHGRPGRGGFTLIELLVVISIVAVLSSMLMGAIALVRASAVQTACGNKMRQIGIATDAYLADNEWIFFDPNYWAKGLDFYTTGSQTNTAVAALLYPEAWRCRATARNRLYPTGFWLGAQGSVSWWGSYGFNSALTGSAGASNAQSKITSAPSKILLVDGYDNNDFNGASAVNLRWGENGGRFDRRHSEKCNALYADYHVGGWFTIPAAADFLP